MNLGLHHLWERSRKLENETVDFFIASLFWLLYGLVHKAKPLIYTNIYRSPFPAFSHYPGYYLTSSLVCFFILDVNIKYIV